MTIFSLADHYSMWTKSTVVNILSAFGDSDFKRSDSKEVLIENLEGYFVPAVIEIADVKALTQLAEAASLLQKGRKYKRDKLVSLLIEFQEQMKASALSALESTPEDSEEFTRLARIVFTTDADLHAQLETEWTEE